MGDLPWALSFPRSPQPSSTCTPEPRTEVVRDIQSTALVKAEILTNESSPLRAKRCPLQDTDTPKRVTRPVRLSLHNTISFLLPLDNRPYGCRPWRIVSHKRSCLER